MTRRTSWFRSPRLRRKQLSASRGERSPAGNSKRRNRRLLLERLEDRALLAGEVIPNDPEFPQQWMLHNSGQTGGTIDADIDAPEAWSVTTGSMVTVVAVLDSGVDYTDPDLYLNIWLNEGEIPAGIAASLTDSDSDGILTFRDLNNPANASYVSDLNATGYIDGGDLLADPTWENGLDEDGNSRTDDLVGWDFYNNDNDPLNTTDVHGTGMSIGIGGLGNNGIGKAGINWSVRIMPIQIHTIGGAQTDQVITNVAAGLDYVVAKGVPISNNSWGDNTYSQAMFDAINGARAAGHLFVAAAGNLSQDMDANPFFPAAYNLDNIISVGGIDQFNQLTSGTNFGAVNVDLAGYSQFGGTSQPTHQTTGVAALLKSVHPDWTYSQIKDRILSTVDPLPSLAGKTVTGGHLNAANALGVVQATKFYVVDDATANRTFEYGSGVGLAREAYGLAAANAAPRGAASTAAGDKVWVVDVNKTVYVYDAAGVLLGSWTAGSLTGGAQVEGIATNGTDVWIVDAKQDKVYRYTGAASRLSGSQNAASSFALNSDNKDPKDIVVGGTSLWVVNNSTTDKVFKYSQAGSLLGSWTISTAGVTSPTGITLDPANPNDLWIVDNGTDRVYQYDTAVSRTSGSQAASTTTSFALAAGNTNPQGIADPPVGGSFVPALAANVTPAVAPVSVLAGVQAISGTGQASTLTGDPDEQDGLDGLAMFLSDVQNPSPLLLDDADVKTEHRMAGTRLSSTYDEALCDIAAELDSLTSASGLRIRTIRSGM